VEIGVADARVLDVDEDLIGAGLLDGDSLVDDGWGEESCVLAWGRLNAGCLKGKRGGGGVRPPVFSTTCAHCSEGISMLPMMDDGCGCSV
jgi:hypothetical protein